MSCLQGQFDDTFTHGISLGGNHAYYTNYLRTTFKRHWQLKELY